MALYTRTVVPIHSDEAKELAELHAFDNIVEDFGDFVQDTWSDGIATTLWLLRLVEGAMPPYPRQEGG